MPSRSESQAWDRTGRPGYLPVRTDRIVANPKLKLLDQVREVMRLKHYSIRTERCYCDWIRRYVKFHHMRSREDLANGEAKIEEFLSDLAVHGGAARPPPSGSSRSPAGESPPCHHGDVGRTAVSGQAALRKRVAPDGGTA